MEVYVATMMYDDDEEVLGVYATPELAIDALKTRSPLGTPDARVDEGARGLRGRYWYLTNPPEQGQTIGRQWVGAVRRYTVQGIGQLYEQVASEGAEA